MPAWLVGVISLVVVKWLIPALKNRGGAGAEAVILDLRCYAGYLAKEMSFTLHLPPSDCSSEPAGTILLRAKSGVDVRAISSLNVYYSALLEAYGPQHWWPGRSRFEVIVGAILTQNTSWSNVTLAMENLRRERFLTVSAMASVRTAKLEQLIRSSGYFRQKTKTLKAFVRFVRTEYAGLLTQMFRTPTMTLRRQLLAVRGIGPETADCILLYAGKHPVFVVDAYTRRILERHGHIEAKAGYDEIRAIFERSISPNAALYNEFHALIVQAGKKSCRPGVPRCNECPLQPFLPQLTGSPS